MFTEGGSLLLVIQAFTQLGKSISLPWCDEILMHVFDACGKDQGLISPFTHEAQDMLGLVFLNQIPSSTGSQLTEGSKFKNKALRCITNLFQGFDHAEGQICLERVAIRQSLYDIFLYFSYIFRAFMHNLLHYDFFYKNLIILFCYLLRVKQAHFLHCDIYKTGSRDHPACGLAESYLRHTCRSPAYKTGEKSVKIHWYLQSFQVVKRTQLKNGTASLPEFAVDHLARITDAMPSFCLMYKQKWCKEAIN